MALYRKPDDVETEIEIVPDGTDDQDTKTNNNTNADLESKTTTPVAIREIDGSIPAPQPYYYQDAVVEASGKAAGLATVAPKGKPDESIAGAAAENTTYPTTTTSSVTRIERPKQIFSE